MHRSLAFTLMAGLALATGSLAAAERREPGAAPKAAQAAPVDLFDAIRANDVEVKLIPKDSTEARMFIANKTNRPLTVRMPVAFAGVPILAQAVGGVGRGGGSSNNSATQSMGGGGMMGGMGGGMMGGMGMMNIAPEQVAKLRYKTVCLEHGKKDPRPGIPYEIRPLAEVTTKPGVQELLAALSAGKIGQREAQAAAWHLANDMTWEQLAAKRIEHLDGTSEQWFSPQEIHGGMQGAHIAVRLAVENAAQKSPVDTASLNKPAVAVEAAAE
ncbi:MAG: hypothetical protein AB7O59_01130 [Pirellulales bacterium]